MNKLANIFDCADTDSEIITVPYYMCLCTHSQRHSSMIGYEGKRRENRHLEFDN